MDCRQARDALIAAAEWPLSAAEHDDMAAHLAGCAACRRFAAGAHGWRGAHRGTNTTGFVAGRGVPVASTPDLTERVLASVRPLPPPWVYEQTRRRRKRSHLLGLVVAAVGATFAFVTVSVALVVALASDSPPSVSGAFPRLATEAVVNANMRGWFTSLTTDAARFAVTLALLLLPGFRVVPLAPRYRRPCRTRLRISSALHVPRTTGTGDTVRLLPRITNRAAPLLGTRNAERGTHEVISFAGVTRRYATGRGEAVALDDVSLTVNRGEWVAVVGPSGSGKSTLMNLVAGIDRASSGSVIVAGHDLSRMGEERLARWRGRQVGIVFQFFQLMPTLTVRENVLLPMELRGGRRDREARAISLLDQVGVARLANKLPSELSGGEQQRVAIARALANDPAILLADEPTGNLDTATAKSSLTCSPP